MNQGSHCCTFSSASGVVSVLDFGQPNNDVITSFSCFSLHVCDDICISSLVRCLFRPTLVCVCVNNCKMEMQSTKNSQGNSEKPQIEILQKSRPFTNL